eukprot:COSAG01_NODE_5385_length_4293_cov_19.521221_7_plen_321_part_00
MSSDGTIFSAPTVGDPRATGIKNGGIKAFESDIVYPVSRLVNDQFKAGRQLEFRWRSDSNRFWSPRDTKMYVKYAVQFGEARGAPNVDTARTMDMSSGGPSVATPTAAQIAANKRSIMEVTSRVRITAAPNTCLFDGGMRYLQNSVVVENQTEPYTAAMAQLVTKTDLAGTDTSAAGILSLRKDVGDEQNTDTRDSDHGHRADNVNPKAELLTVGMVGKTSEFEVAEPVFLASWQHGYAVGPSDHQLFLTISNNFIDDLLVCPQTKQNTQPLYREVLYGDTDGAAELSRGQIRICVKSVELHVAYVAPSRERAQRKTLCK